MGIAMPHLDGIEATRRIACAGSRPKIVALSACADEHMVDRVLRAGASAYLSKETAFNELVRAICTVVAGEVYLGLNVAAP